MTTSEKFMVNSGTGLMAVAKYATEGLRSKSGWISAI